MTPRSAARVEVTVDGRPVLVRPGTSVAAALLEQGRWDFRVDPVSGRDRGPYCGMGVCLECEVTVDARPHVRACLERVREGMRIDTAASGEDT
ncbi:(2Fe-2S)-binding protein [Nocardiopsis changdeensis]|uniref:(2Fe-2S)-binding protein n=1 Tax=Nocardiopsis changdeensis TaxID=2831969 RepID=A0ABX8BEY9_9ACTN|nr:MULTISPECIES: (2Fe-2S)-binding protein [Nocardiopsis]QUX20711.1 (2Fe-2S)-binding protein [Nocardiopsis changdeensis]QYX36643.1 (2Fe-2S)-binding protein [Nocardiopsis sp. MT53]